MTASAELTILRLLPHHSGRIRSAARLLRDGFPANAVYRTPEGSQEEVDEVLSEGIAFCAMRGGRVLGWIGALPAYDDHVWEMHPLVVAPAAQRQGIGRALVAHLEDAARSAGVMTIMLGTDDEDERTTASQYDDLYAHLPGVLAQITSRDPLNLHPVDFYRRCGYTVVGVVPDANGHRKPDILMAKRIG